MNRRWRSLIPLLALVLALGTTPVQAQSGSYIDSLYQATDHDEGRADELTPAEPAAPEAPAAPPAEVSSSAVPGESEINYQCGGSTMTQAQLEELIRRIIAQIMSAGGGCGVRIIIIRTPGCGGITSPGGGTGTSTGPSTGTGISTGTGTGTGTGPSTGTGTGTGTSANAGDIAGLKAEMRSKYGINATAGYGGADWSARQLEEALKVLASLPERYRSCTKNIQRDAGGLPGMPPGVLGWVQPGIPTVHLLNSACYQGTFQGTLVHEMAHCFQANFPAVQAAFERQFWPNGRYGGPISSSVSSYGNTQPVEDFAESCRQYWQAGAYMRQTNPARYEFIKNNVFDGKEF
ncbi:MAG: Period clock protein [Candidatus Ozemobacter sibiricus]|jgi:hypothetical protein|uniref:Period clock protein n=1 Tax=Candidatus Ozemobacter sibiricus TaxID=2268124 RepID=A0A367ZPY0_9BACT|nr:MAG: Period clock protein [Candidatus Ozemobacter sibiricus]